MRSKYLFLYEVTKTPTYLRSMPDGLSSKLIEMDFSSYAKPANCYLFKKKKKYKTVKKRADKKFFKFIHSTTTQNTHTHQKEAVLDCSPKHTKVVRM